MSDVRNDEMNGEKSRLRKQAQVRRARAFAEFGGDTKRQMARHASDILDLLTKGSQKTIAGYYPIKDEIDCTGLLGVLHKSAAIALPRMRGADQVLDFHLWDQSSELVKGDFGVMEPPASAERVRPDLVLVPLLAFDLRGGRIGYGGGFYDRTLSVLRGQGDIIAIGAGFDEQEFEAVPVGPLDQRLDYIVTPTRLVRV